MSIPNFTLRLALLPLLGTLVTAKAQDNTVAQAGKSIVFDYAQNNPPPEPAPNPEATLPPEPAATPASTPAPKAASEPPPKAASVEAPLPTGGPDTPTGNVTINLINKLVKRMI